MAGMFDDFVTHGEKINELKREVQYRRHVYSRLVAENKMAQRSMDRRIQIVEAVIDDYEKGRVQQCP